LLQDNRRNIKARREITAIAAITEDIITRVYIGTINGFERYIKRGYLLQVASFSFRVVLKKNKQRISAIPIYSQIKINNP